LGFIGYLLEDLGPAEQFPIVVAGKNVRRPWHRQQDTRSRVPE
jgi:hypothetical protein